MSTDAVFILAMVVSLLDLALCASQKKIAAIIRVNGIPTIQTALTSTGNSLLANMMPDIRVRHFEDDAAPAEENHST